MQIHEYRIEITDFIRAERQLHEIAQREISLAAEIEQKPSSCQNRVVNMRELEDLRGLFITRDLAQGID